MSIALIQSASAVSPSGTGVAKAFASAVASGNLIEVTLVWRNASTGGITWTVTDNQGNTYTSAVRANDGADGAFNRLTQKFYAKNVTGGSITVTATASAAVNTTAPSITIILDEWSGLDTAAPLDKTATGANFGTSSGTGSSGTLSQANELVTCSVYNEAAGLTPGSGYTQDATFPNEYKTVAATTAVTGSWTWTGSATWTMALATYKLATAGIAFDATSNSGYQAAQSSYSWSHTNAGNFLAVDVSMLSVPGTTVTGVTYNGVALTRIASQYTASAIGGVECWGLVNPAIGTSTIAVTLSATIISAGTAVSYSGVNPYQPTESPNGAFATNVGAADATVTITPIADQTWVHGAVATTDTAITAGQTSRNNVTGTGGTGADEDTGPISPAAGTAVSYTNVDALATWAIAGYALRPVGSPYTVGGELTYYPLRTGRFPTLICY